MIYFRSVIAIILVSFSVFFFLVMFCPRDRQLRLTKPSYLPVFKISSENLRCQSRLDCIYRRTELLRRKTKILPLEAGPQKKPASTT
jgi:hypothetical protein